MILTLSPICLVLECEHAGDDISLGSASINVSCYQYLNVPALYLPTNTLTTEFIDNGCTFRALNEKESA